MKTRYNKTKEHIGAFTKTSVSYAVAITLFFMAALVSSCDSDDVGDSYYTFTEEMMGSYFEERPEEFSEFVRMLDTTNVLGLLNAYGDYTCFAPNNEAVAAFYASKGRSTLEEFPYDTIVKIVYDHIIKDTEVKVEDFIEGRLPYLTMSNRYVSVSFANYANDTAIITVNKFASILYKDKTVHNGVIHTISEVLKPTDKTLVEALSEDDRYNLFSEALIETGLYNQLALIRDESYDVDALDEGILNKDIGEVYPEFKKYGYTALVESDETYAAAGITNLESMANYAKRVYDKVYPEDAGKYDGEINYRNRRSPLNRFIAYHLINKQISRSKFIDDYDTDHMLKNHDMYEYIETMCPNTLIEVWKERTSGRTNLLNYINVDDVVELDETNYDMDALNGVYHEINKVLTYNLDVASYLASKRLRMDAAAFFPEFTNNNMRGNGVVVRYILPDGYIKRLELSEGTKFSYLNADDRYLDYQGDEIFLKGLYDFTITTSVVPAGTYEVRMGYQPTLNRGAAQLYLDGLPCGIPLDLTLDADDAAIGYEEPGTNPSDPNGYENDKMMRNRGYMKGPNTFKVVDASTGWGYDGSNSRLSKRYVRRILGIQIFHEAGEHQFKVKAAREGEFMLDFLEFVPLEIIEKEGID